MRIVAIEAFTADQLQQDPEGRNVLPSGAGDADVVAFTLVDVNQNEVLRFVPYNKLVAELNAGAVLQLAGTVGNWPKCFLSVTNPAGIASVPAVAYFLVHFATPEEYAQLSMR